MGYLEDSTHIGGRLRALRMILPAECLGDDEFSGPIGADKLYHRQAVMWAEATDSPCGVDAEAIIYTAGRDTEITAVEVAQYAIPTGAGTVNYVVERLLADGSWSAVTDEIQYSGPSGFLDPKHLYGFTVLDPTLPAGGVLRLRRYHSGSSNMGSGTILVLTITEHAYAGGVRTRFGDPVEADT